jgi:hypothetical protein
VDSTTKIIVGLTVIFGLIFNPSTSTIRKGNKMNYLKKITSAAIDAVPKGYRDWAHGDQKATAHIIGVVEKTEAGVTSLGEYIAFIGSFKATNLETGEVYRSKKCLLPGVASDALEDAVNGSEGGAVEFAIEIGIKRNIKKNAQGEEVGVGYEYTMKPLIEMDETADPLARLESRIPKAIPALASVPETPKAKPKAA